MKHLLFTLLLPLLFLGSAQSAQPTVDLVASLPGENRQPVGSLTLGADGNFYGMSAYGGSTYYGNIFKMTPQGSVSTVLQFTGTQGSYKGSYAYGGLTKGSDGHLYGMTEQGGVNDYGTIFKLSDEGVFSTLVDFTYNANSNKGANPYGDLTLGSDGNLYGMTFYGGTGGNGTIFKMTPQGVLTTLVNLSTSGPRYPFGNLIQAPNGDFYGMSLHGGFYGYGTVFKLTSNNTLSTLVDFTGNGATNKGGHPYGRLTFGSDGFLYGTTGYGGANNLGTLFKTDLEGNLTTLVDFTGNGSANKGAYPFGSLTLGQDGNFYGMTNGGGTNGQGTVFQMTPQGILTTLVEFTGAGAGPESGANPSYGHFIPDAQGNLYALIQSGGANEAGAVIRINVPPLLPTVELAASLPTEIRYPQGSLTLGVDGNLYGMSYSGGQENYGSLFKVTSQGVVSTVLNFTGTQGSYKGAYAYGGLTKGSDGHLYGMTQQGGVNNLGTIFKLSNEGVFSTLVEFTNNGVSNKGSAPLGDLTLGSDGNFYGMTYTGGTGGGGTIFKMTPQGVLTTLTNLSASGPRYPYGKLIQVPNGDFYGMSTGGGANGVGTIFKLTSDNTISTVVNFTGIGETNIGTTPFGSLTFGSDGFLYGMTTFGGSNHNGTIFKIDLQGNLTTLVEFTGNDSANKGTYPYGSLTLGQNGNFYGMTSMGGLTGRGTVFQMTPQGVLTTLVEFTGEGAGPESGASPSYGHFTPDAQGNLYALTQLGGANDAGTVIRIRFNVTAPATAPVITVTGNGASIPHNDTTPSTEDYTDFGQVNVTSGAKAQSFTLTNTGDGELTLSSSAVSVTGTDFTVTSQPGTTVEPEGSSTFEITFNPSTLGVKTATVSIASNDADTPTYTFAITGTGIDAPTVTPNTATNVQGYTATLNGSVNPNGAATIYTFQYGTDSGLTTSISTGTQSVSAGFSSSSVAANLSGLKADTTYYYQVTAMNDEGTRTSTISSFTTNYPLISGEQLIGAQGMPNGGTIYRPLPGVINNAGRILFQSVGQAGSGVTPDLVTGANDEWLMSDASGSPRVLLREGDQLSAGNYMSALFNHILLGESGQSFTSEKISGATTDKDYAYLAIPLAGTSVDIVSQEGDTAPDTGVFVNSVGKPALDNQENLYFQGSLSGVATTLATGVWYDNGEELATLVQAGQSITSVTGDPAWLGKVSNILAAGGNGASFVAALQPNPANTKEKTDTLRNQAIISANVDGSEVNLTIIARKGDTVTGGTTLSSISGLARGVNEGHAFTALMKTGSGVTTANDEILATAVEGETIIIAREGTTQLASGFTPKTFGDFYVTATGDVIFQAVLSGAPATSDGILCKWVAATEEIEVLAREGDSAPGAGGLNYGTLHTVSVSDNGNIVMQTILSDGKHALHRNTGSGFNLIVRAGTGQTINFGGGSRNILSIGLYNKTTNAGGGGGGMGSAINDSGDIFTVLSIGSSEYITRIYRGETPPPLRRD